MAESRPARPAPRRAGDRPRTEGAGGPRGAHIGRAAPRDPPLRATRRGARARRAGVSTLDTAASPELGGAHGDDVLGALRRERLAASLAALFGSADPAIADDLLRLGQWLPVRGGERLFRQGDPGDAMFLLVVGRLVAVREDGAVSRRVVGRIRPGECVGEMGLLATQPRTATVEASRDSVVVRISEDAFRRV